MPSPPPNNGPPEVSPACATPGTVATASRTRFITLCIWSRVYTLYRAAAGTRRSPRPLEAGLPASPLPKLPRQQARADEQHERQRQLHDDEGRAQAGVAGSV